MDFIESRCMGFEEYKESILNDPFANPEYTKNIKGYEYLANKSHKLQDFMLLKSQCSLGIRNH